MQSENLLRSDYAMEQMNNSNMSNSNSPVNSPADQVKQSIIGILLKPFHDVSLPSRKLSRTNRLFLGTATVTMIF